MRNIIEELYYGNITPCDRDIIKGGIYSHLLHLVTRNEDDLMQTLTQAQKETFEKFKDCASELLAGLAHTPAKATGPTKTATPTLAQ